ncbi:hypothetical protein JTZ62_04540 [Mammaliicoccus sciuri]|uniref:hypothetical protein n=1 Tax=Mammaliicoccus sciuri TaxID=1296 RepID=UPI0019D3E70F|nr:hypothetical protein [Mammaliicoccus sciuri]QSN68426.1 hypothetical protein JTZ62_04540 [Mammaliicoccus sciuri]UIU23167.1 hypothetical protein LLZ87_04550 [Mammaliicoccus sciuri]UIU26072.1 hypothetical protein LLZ92_04550 [Mammaliicoccus sciuri]
MNTIYTQEYLLNECITVDRNGKNFDLSSLLIDEIDMKTASIEPLIKIGLIDEKDLKDLTQTNQIKIIDKVTNKVISSY